MVSATLIIDGMVVAIKSIPKKEKVGRNGQIINKLINSINYFLGFSKEETSSPNQHLTKLVRNLFAKKNYLKQFVNSAASELEKLLLMLFLGLTEVNQKINTPKNYFYFYGGSVNVL